ncbi:MAG: FAD-dependent oxidoreductase, partial [Bryobacterales bacterium]|nr:FAD-dependent oxidoreductase [Bryobacterales bacterium]
MLFIEEPVRSNEPDHWRKQSTDYPSVTVYTPVTQVEQPGFCAAQLPHLKALIQGLIAEEKPRSSALWFYTPMALPLADQFQPIVTLYDCMDELTGFAGAPPELASLEAELFQKADIIFTGGQSLYEAKASKHSNVHCFPSSVDLIHYSQARMADLDHPDQAALPRPRLGYFGVIDERLDLGLLQTIAERHPKWQISMVGPVAKIDPATLPKLENVHYFDQRTYDELPKFLAGWDICLLPFALNDATRFISPTKTLEYMAGEKAIVSTPIRDVVACYSDVVRIADSADTFVHQCEETLADSEEAKHTRSTRMKQILETTSWDMTAANMDVLMEQAAAKQKVTPLGGQPKDIIIGAGPTGLSAAYHLGEDALLLERNGTAGGWCRSIQVNGFTFDYAGHIMFSNDASVHGLYRMLLGDNVHWQNREAWIFSQGVYTRYPFQGSLYGLPPKVIQECIMGAIEARFGTPLKSNGTDQSRRVIKISTVNSNTIATSVSSNGYRPAVDRNCIVEANEDCCADGVLELNTPLAASTSPSGDHEPPQENFEEFIYRTWGSGIAKHFAIPYNQKLWAVPLSEMETSWLGGRVPLPDLEEMIEGGLVPKPRPMGPNARFGYPLRGGFQALMEGFLPHLKGELRLNTDVIGISPKNREIYLSDGETVGYRNLVSTMPLPELIRIIGAEAPSAIRRAAEGLRYTSVCCVHIGVGRSDVSEKHWIYYPGDTVFHRIFVQGNASPYCNPPGGFGFTCEITYGPLKPLPCDGEELIQLCIRDAKRAGFIREDDPIWATALVHLPCAYVVYDHQRAGRVKQIRQWLAGSDIILAGRYSEWEYYNSDHAFIAGKRAAEQILTGQ